MARRPRSQSPSAPPPDPQTPPPVERPVGPPPVDLAFYAVDRSAEYFDVRPPEGPPELPPGPFPDPNEPTGPLRPEAFYPPPDSLEPVFGPVATGRALLAAEAHSAGAHGARVASPPGPHRIGGLVVWLRERLGMTQVALAREAGLSQSSLSQLESGSNARAETLYAVARTLGVSVSTLFGEPVEALEPEDANFYRDFVLLRAEARHEIRQYVLFRWLQQAGDQFIRSLEGRRDARVMQHLHDMEWNESTAAASPTDAAPPDPGAAPQARKRAGKRAGKAAAHVAGTSTGADRGADARTGRRAPAKRGSSRPR